jgi:hypothetical protein
LCMPPMSAVRLLTRTLERSCVRGSKESSKKPSPPSRSHMSSRHSRHACATAEPGWVNGRGKVVTAAARGAGEALKGEAGAVGHACRALRCTGRLGATRSDSDDSERLRRLGRLGRLGVTLTTRSDSDDLDDSEHHALDRHLGPSSGSRNSHTSEKMQLALLLRCDLILWSVSCTLMPSRCDWYLALESGSAGFKTELTRTRIGPVSTRAETCDDIMIN